MRTGCSAVSTIAPAGVTKGPTTTWGASARRRASLASAAVVLAVSVLAVSTSVASATPQGPPTWSDEFNGTSLDLNNWYYRATGPRHDGFLTPNAVSVGDGSLKIRAYTEGGSHYSGMITTQPVPGNNQGFEQIYGYWEARIQFHDTPGEWSAFWVQTPTNGSPLGDPGTAGVEMDVVEHRVRCLNGPAPCNGTTDISDRADSALIWDGYGADNKATVKLSDPLPGLAGGGGWHTWGMSWSPTLITFFYDGTPTWSVTGPISRRAQHVILSSEIWGAFAGAIPAGGYGDRNASTTNMLVDYVRVWSPAAAAAVPPSSTSPPGLSGANGVGQPLSCSSGGWSGAPAPTFAYAWLRDGAAISGQTSTFYIIHSADQGHTLLCRVTAANAAGTSASNSGARAIPPADVLQTSSVHRPPVVVPKALVTLSGGRVQQIGRRVLVQVRCSTRCAGVTSAKVQLTTGHRSSHFSLPVDRRTMSPGHTVKVRLSISALRRTAIRRTLRAHGHVTVVFTVKVSGAGALVRTLHRSTKLRL